jgi:hypothetical protein
MASTTKTDIVKPTASGGSLILQGDSGGSGVSGPSINATGDVDFTQNTDAKIKLPSAGGIYESDGSTPVVTESGGAVTIANSTFTGAIGASATGYTGVKVAAQWRLNANFTSLDTGINVLTDNWIVSNSTGYSGIGSAFTQASGVFTFPATGIYYIDGAIQVNDSAAYQVGIIIDTTINADAGSPTFLNSAWQYVDNSSAGQSGVSVSTMFDVTDVGTCKVRLSYNTSAEVTILGNSGQNYTGVKFIRLGDT